MAVAWNADGRAPREPSIPVSDTPTHREVRYAQPLRGRCGPGRRARSLPGRAAGSAGATRGARGARGVLRRAFENTAARRPRAGHGRDPAAVVARCPGDAGWPSAPAIRSPTPFARPRNGTQLPVGLLEALIDGRSLLLPRASPLDGGDFARSSVENRRRPVCPGRPCRGPAGRRRCRRSLCRLPARLTAWCVCCSACPGRSRRVTFRWPQLSSRLPA